MAEVPAFTLWLEFEEWVTEPHHDPEDDFFNMVVEVADGRCYALNVWTFRFLERARWEREFEAEDLVGRYLVAPDLFVERLDRPLLERVVADLLANEAMKEEWLAPEESEDDDPSVDLSG